MAFSYCLQLADSTWHSHLKLLQCSFTKQGSDNASIDNDEHQSSPLFCLCPYKQLYPSLNVEAKAWYQLSETEIMTTKGMEM